MKSLTIVFESIQEFEEHMQTYKKGRALDMFDGHLRNALKYDDCKLIAQDVAESEDVTLSHKIQKAAFEEIVRATVYSIRRELLVITKEELDG